MNAGAPRIGLLLLALSPLSGCAAAEDRPLVQDEKSVLDRLSAYGNMRLRGESTFNQLNDEDRHRGRVRMRAGVKYEATDDITAEARLSTTSDGDDANSPYWDFGDGAEGFDGAEVVLDRIFMNWNATEGLDLRGGKFGHALATPPVYSELVWDADVNPAGVAAIWDPEANTVDYDLRVVEYIAVENGGDDDSTMFGAQGNLIVPAGDMTDIHLATSWMKWSSLDANGGTFDNQGNTDVTGDFSIWESFLAATHDGGPLGRTQGFVEYMNNTDDDDDEDQGWAVGAKCGRSGSQGDANLFLVYYDLDANCVFSPVAQDDTPIAGTGVGDGMKGFIGGGQYYYRDNISLRLWGLSSDTDDGDPWRLRFDIDIVVK